MSVIGRQLLLKCGKLFDLAAMVLSFALASLLVVHGTTTVSLSEFLAVRVKLHNVLLFAGSLLAWHAVFCWFGLYESRRFSVRKAELLDVAKASILGATIVGIAKFMCGLEMVTPAFLAMFGLISTSILTSSRLAVRYILERARLLGRNLRDVVIIGTNPRAVHLARKIETKPTLGCRVVGFVDGDWGGMESFR